MYGQNSRYELQFAVIRRRLKYILRKSFCIFLSRHMCLERKFDSQKISTYSTGQKGLHKPLFYKQEGQPQPVPHCLYLGQFYSVQLKDRKDLLERVYIFFEEEKITLIYMFQLNYYRKIFCINTGSIICPRSIYIRIPPYTIVSALPCSNIYNPSMNSFS